MSIRPGRDEPRKKKKKKKKNAPEGKKRVSYSATIQVSVSLVLVRTLLARMRVSRLAGHGALNEYTPTIPERSNRREMASSQMEGIADCEIIPTSV